MPSALQMQTSPIEQARISPTTNTKKQQKARPTNAKHLLFIIKYYYLYYILFISENLQNITAL